MLQLFVYKIISKITMTNACSFSPLSSAASFAQPLTVTENRPEIHKAIADKIAYTPGLIFSPILLYYSLYTSLFSVYFISNQKYELLK